MGYDWFNLGRLQWCRTFEITWRFSSYDELVHPVNAGGEWVEWSLFWFQKIMISTKTHAIFQSMLGCSTSAMLITMGDLLSHRLVPSCRRGPAWTKKNQLCMSSILISWKLSWLDVFSAQDPSPTAGTTMPLLAAYARYGLASKRGSGSGGACAAGKFERP